MNSQQGASERRADQRRGWNSGIQTGNSTATLLPAKPMRQINNHPRKETRLGSAKQYSRNVKLRDVVDEPGQKCDQAPRNHDPCDPFAATPPFHDDGAWDFK